MTIPILRAFANTPEGQIHYAMAGKGKPVLLLSREVIVNLISSTTTDKGLRIQASLDEANCETGIKVSDKDLRTISIKHADFHGDWNYAIKPIRRS